MAQPNSLLSLLNDDEDDGVSIQLWCLLSLVITRPVRAPLISYEAALSPTYTVALLDNQLDEL